jgi:hypothetical protein
MLQISHYTMKYVTVVKKFDKKSLKEIGKGFQNK